MLAFYLDDPSTEAALLKLGTWSPLLGVLGILLVQALVSFAIVRYFRTPWREHAHCVQDARSPRSLGGAADAVLGLAAARQPPDARGRRRGVPFVQVIPWVIADRVRPRLARRPLVQGARPRALPRPSAASCTRTPSHGRPLRLVIAQHQDDAPPGLLGDWAAAAGLETTIVRPDRGERLPDAARRRPRRAARLRRGRRRSATREWIDREATLGAGSRARAHARARHLLRRPAAGGRARRVAPARDGARDRLDRGPLRATRTRCRPARGSRGTPTRSWRRPGRDGDRPQPRRRPGLRARPASRRAVPPRGHAGDHRRLGGGGRARPRRRRARPAHAGAPVGRPRRGRERGGAAALRPLPAPRRRVPADRPRGGRHDRRSNGRAALDPTAAERVAKAIQSGAVDEIEILWPDHQGHARGKRIEARGFLDRAAGSGFAFCDAALDVGRRGRHQGAACGCRAGARATRTSTRSPTSRRSRRCPGARAPAQVVCDLFDHHGDARSAPRPAPCCGASSTGSRRSATRPRSASRSSSTCSTPRAARSFDGAARLLAAEAQRARPGVRRDPRAACAASSTSRAATRSTRPARPRSTCATRRRSPRPTRPRG